MPDFVLKDRSGNDITYSGTKLLRLPTADGGTADFVSGTLVEKTVELDFSGGDMEIVPEGEELYARVSIPKPNTLIPETILSGITIAGVTGNYEGSSSSEVVTEQYVNFRDYQGNVVCSYSKGEALAMTVLPEAPKHPEYGNGFWNWTLAKIQDALDYGIIDVGVIYTFNKTKIVVNLVSTKTVTLHFNTSATIKKTKIEWGDGTTATNSAASVSHTYSDYGEYVILVSPNGTYSTYSEFEINGIVPSLSVKKIHVGSNMSDFAGSFLLGTTHNYFRNVEEILISSSSRYNQEWKSFETFNKLKYIAFPALYTTFRTFSSLPSLEVISFSNNVTTFNGNRFSSCYNLKRVPNLKYVTSGISSYGSYNSMYGLLTNEIKLNSITCGDYSCQECYNLRKIEIEEGVTSIPNYFAARCYGLEILILPSTITSCSNYALREGTSTYDQDLAQLRIYVPDDMVSTYKTMTNLSRFSSRIFPLSELPVDT